MERELERGLGPSPRLPFEPLPAWVADLPEDVRERVGLAWGVELPGDRVYDPGMSTRTRVSLSAEDVDKLRVWVERGRDWIHEFSASASWEDFERERQEALGLLERGSGDQASDHLI